MYIFLPTGVAFFIRKEVRDMEAVAVDTSRIRAERGRLKMSQTELAKRVGTTQTHISMIENGLRAEITPDTLGKIALSLGVSVDYLLGLTEERTPYPRARV
jgi:transcriptional regulator with XRE-family HTH domain